MPFKIKIFKLIISCFLILHARQGLADFDSQFTSAQEYLHLRTGRELDFKRQELIKNAQHSIYLTSFIFTADAYQYPTYALLCQRAQEGIDVRILLDWVGSYQGQDTIQKYTTSREKNLFRSVSDFEKCGIKIQFSPNISWGPDSVVYAKHDKFFVVDGNELIIGGSNFGQEYSQHGPQSQVWYDQDIYLKGHIACKFQNKFNDIWTSQYLRHLQRHFFEGYDHFVESYHPQSLIPCIKKAVPGNIQVLGIYNDPYFSEKRPLFEAYKTMITQIIKSGTTTGYKEKIQLYAPYFIPDKAFRLLLIQAKAHGHDVEIITNSRESIDKGALASFEGMLLITRELLEAGIKIYLWNPLANTKDADWGHSINSIFHKKGGIYGDVYSVIGSDNLDARGQNYSSEAIVILKDKKLNQELKKIYEEDKKHCEIFTLEMREKLIEETPVLNLKFANKILHLL